MTKVSIILTVYNTADYLEQALNSLLNQTLKDIEIICINDGSTDNSLAILQKYSALDNRIKVINQSNKGIGYSRNLGISLSKGEYIAFVDSDDYVFPTTYEKAYDKAKESGNDIVIFNFECLLEDGTELHPDVKKYFNVASYFKNNEVSENFNYRDIKENILRVSWNIWNKIYKRDFINKNKIKFINTFFQDSPFHLEAMILAKNISFINENLYSYRIQNPSSVTNTHYKSRKIFDFFVVADEMKKMLLKHDKFGELERQYLEFKLVVLNSHFGAIVNEKIKKDFYLNIIDSVKSEKYTIKELRDFKFALAPDHFLYSLEFEKDFNSFGLYNSLLTKIAKLYFMIFK